MLSLFGITQHRWMFCGCFMSFMAINSVFCDVWAQDGGWTPAPYQDSVAVFHRPDKVIVLIKDQGIDSRLSQFMQAWNLKFNSEENVILWKNADASLTIRCFHNGWEQSCTFKLLPISNKVQISAKTAIFEEVLPTAMSENMEFFYRSSMDNIFNFTYESGQLKIATQRR